MESGFVRNDPKNFASQIYSSVKNSLNISPDVAVEEEDDIEEVETESSAKEAEEQGSFNADEASEEYVKDEL